MQDVDAPAGDWSTAVSEATRHVEERLDAQAVAEERQGPVSRQGLVTVASMVLLGLIAANVWLIVQPATASDPLFYARENRAWTLVDAADVIEDFRLETGRLPTADEVAADLEEVVSYQSRGDEYVLTLSDGPTLSYDSALPVEDWLAAVTGGGG